MAEAAVAGNILVAEADIKIEAVIKIKAINRVTQEVWRTHPVLLNCRSFSIALL